jgi:hypothetical protein
VQDNSTLSSCIQRFGLFMRFLGSSRYRSVHRVPAHPGPVAVTSRLRRACSDAIVRAQQPPRTVGTGCPDTHEVQSTSGGSNKQYTTKVMYTGTEDTAVHRRGVAATRWPRDGPGGTQREDGLGPQRQGCCYEARIGPALSAVLPDRSRGPRAGRALGATASNEVKV